MRSLEAGGDRVGQEGLRVGGVGAGVVGHAKPYPPGPAAARVTTTPVPPSAQRATACWLDGWAYRPLT